MTPPDPRSPSLDAAVEAGRAEMVRYGHDIPRSMLLAVLEAALPHLPAAPSGEAREPSDDEVHRTMFAADTAFLEAQRRGLLGAEALRLAVKAALAVDRRVRVDRLREPSPEQRDRMAETAARAIEGRDGQHPYGREFRRHYGAEGLGKFAADAVLAALREEQGGG